MLRYLRQLAKHSPLGFVVRRLRRPPAPVPLDPIAQQHAEYDRNTVAIINRVLTPTSNAVDVGAHAGAILSEIVAVAPNGRHHAFEPLPHLAEPLAAAFPTVTVHQQALSDKPGTATFQHVLNDPGYSGLQRRQYDRPDPVLEELTVEVVRLDDVIEADESIAFIKLDIEGGEYHALRGALATICRCQPVIVFEAARCSTGCYGVTAGALFDLIDAEMGYNVWTLRAWLTGGAAYTREAFEENWQSVREYYFVAGPARA